MTVFKPVLVGPGDIGVDPAYWAKDHSDLIGQLEEEQLEKLEKSLNETHSDFEDLISNCDQYDEIVHWLGLALFRLIKLNDQVGRNRYVPARKYLGEVEFDVSQALDLMLAVLWKQVKKETWQDYDRRMAEEIPF